MMMQCPRCSTRWRVAAASPMANPLFKCGRCHHLFRQFPGAVPPSEPPASSNRRAATNAEPDTLEFIFPAHQPAELLVPDEPAPTLAAPAPGAPTIGISELRETTEVVAAPLPVASTPDAEALDFEPPRIVLNEPLDVDLDDAGGGDEDDRHALTESIEDDETALQDFDGREDEEATTPRTDTRRVVRVEEMMRTPSGFGTIMRGMGMTLAGFAALALVVRFAPEHASAWLSRLPIAGAGFARDPNLTSKVELKNVQGRFQRLRNARRVFVISGDARNNSPLTIERIEVLGELYGLGGGELDQKIVTTGNRTPLTDLSEAEIALLQRLDPVIALAPGETTPFLIVFLEPPRDLREFSSRVLSVRPTRRASTPAGARDSVG
jgi:predicted Zn finger-like uncharacterized protein